MEAIHEVLQSEKHLDGVAGPIDSPFDPFVRVNDVTDPSVNDVTDPSVNDVL